MATIDFVIPVYNEGEGLHAFHAALANALAESRHVFRFLYVNDGSSDSSSAVLARLADEDSRVRTIELSRNFGHQAAISAGLDAFDADAVIMMDGDGEHPVSMVLALLQLYECGYEVVQTQRMDAKREGFLFKRLTGSAFYWMISRLGNTRIVSGAADFRLLSREAVHALRQLREYHRFYRGMVQWIGFRSVIVPYTPGPRIAGHSKYSIRKMLRLAADGIFSFSLAPLRFALFIGALFLLLTSAEAAYVFSFWLRGLDKALVPGWSSLILMSTLSSGINMVLLGILGVYVGMIFEEVKRRPVYLARSRGAPEGGSTDQPAAEPVTAGRHADSPLRTTDVERPGNPGWQD